MIGAVLIIIVIVVALPVGVLASGALVSGLLGHLLKEEVAKNHEGSELLDLNR